MPIRAADPPDYLSAIAHAIDRWNVAGLCDRSKRNWYGVDLEDTVRAAHKLGVAPDRVRSILVASMSEGA